MRRVRGGGGGRVTASSIVPSVDAAVSTPSASTRVSSSRGCCCCGRRWERVRGRHWIDTASTPMPAHLWCVGNDPRSCSLHRHLSQRHELSLYRRDLLPLAQVPSLTSGNPRGSHPSPPVWTSLPQRFRANPLLVAPRRRLNHHGGGSLESLLVANGRGAQRSALPSHLRPRETAARERLHTHGCGELHQISRNGRYVCRRTPRIRIVFGFIFFAGSGSRSRAGSAPPGLPARSAPPADRPRERSRLPFGSPARDVAGNHRVVSRQRRGRGAGGSRIIPA